MVRPASNTFDEAVELVAQLAADETGAQARLAQNSALLLELLQQAGDPQLIVLYREMQAYEKDYLLTRQRPNMQLAFNVIRPLKEAIANSAGLAADQSNAALAQLDTYQAAAEEVLKLDVDIRSKFNEFDLQAEAVDPISADLTQLAGDEVQRARTQITQTSQFATVVLAVAVLAAVALAGVIAWVLGKSITRNVIRLTETAIELQADNLDARAEVDSADELGQLADSFNAMAVRIKTLVGNLEGQVAMAQTRLFQAVESISESFALDNELLEALVTRAGQLLGAPYGFVYLVGPGSTRMELQVVIGLSEGQVGQRHRWGEGLVGRVWQSGRPLWVDDYDTWTGRAENVAAGAVRAIAGVPLTHQTGGQSNPEVVGVIGLAFGHESTRTFGEREIEVLMRFAQLGSIALDNARLYSEAQQARQAAEAANQAKSDFLASVSHELRTPLTAVLGFAKISKQSLENKLFPKIQADDRRTQRDIRFVSENMEIIVSEGERLTTLINNVLDLAKIEAGKVEWNMQRLSITEVIERATTATAALFEQKGLLLVKELAADLPEIVGDRDKLIQVVINLISNAVKFTPTGSVTCRAAASGNEIIVGVIDTGAGIALEDQPKVFEKFKQVSNTLTDKPQGTGLGLSICKEIVEHHGGRIWVESVVGQGSAFSFALPVHGLEPSRLQPHNRLN